MVKNEKNDEIDLLETLEIIWRKKLNVLFIIAFSLLAVFLEQSFNKDRIKINATTEIRPIKTVDEASYQIFNSVLRSLKPAQAIIDVPNLYKDMSEGKTFKIDKLAVPNDNRMIKNLNINNINKEFLYDLFIEIINEKPNLKKKIKIFNLVKKENYPNKMEYETAVNKLVSSIRLINSGDLEGADFRNEASNVKIQIINHDVEEWEKFLGFLEKQTNLSIQEKITQVFNDYVNYLEIMRKFEIEDLEAKLLSLTDKDKIILLKKNIEILKADNYSDKILSMFKTSPIADKEEFYAARIVADSTLYKLNEIKISPKTLYASVILISGILGIFIVLIANRIQRRR
ncbi:hypothetical protein N8842_01440 [Candidatus Pelagibacter sp.]|nr:hypothetical protein [Candidatus Pelagibacter sp.]MDA7732081.1 hypothetical protein [Candidatus Pelagibacter sp.]MDC1483609.1 hypothetical protein [Pelagibacteraceae bacterium]